MKVTVERWYWIDSENSLDWKSWRWSRSYQWGPLVWSLKPGNDGWLTDRCGQDPGILNDPGITTWPGQENKSGCKVGLQLHRKVWEIGESILKHSENIKKKKNSISSPWLPHCGGWKSGKKWGLELVHIYEAKGKQAWWLKSRKPKSPSKTGDRASQPSLELKQQTSAGLWSLPNGLPELVTSAA